MNIKVVLSLLINAALGLGIIGNFLFANLILGASLVLVVIGVGIISHLGFFEEKKKRNASLALAWINLFISYGCLLLSLGGFLLLLLNSNPKETTIAKSGLSSGQETEGSKIPLSDQTNIATGGERARLGNSGRGEGLDAMGGANADNQNAMREATVHGSVVCPICCGVNNVSIHSDPVQTKRMFVAAFVTYCP